MIETANLWYTIKYLLMDPFSLLLVKSKSKEVEFHGDSLLLLNQLEQKSIMNMLLQHGYLLKGIQDSLTLFLRICNEYAALKTHSDVLSNDMLDMLDSKHNFESYQKTMDNLDTCARKYNYFVKVMDLERENFANNEAVFVKSLDQYVDEQIMICSRTIIELGSD